MLPTYEKVIETHVKNLLQTHMEINKLFIKEQSGFRNNHSCETALNVIIFDWKLYADKGESIIAIFMDFKRAFETINRNKLLIKLSKYVG